MMPTSPLLLALLALTALSPASGSLFAGLVDATSRSDRAALIRFLSTETLSSSTIRVAEGNRLDGGEMRHGVPVAEIADKLQGCNVKQWRDVGSEQGDAYILWECPTRRVPETNCYFYSYRAAMLDRRYHPANLFIHEMPSWDARCGVGRVAPPSM